MRFLFQFINLTRDFRINPASLYMAIYSVKWLYKTAYENPAANQKWTRFIKPSFWWNCNIFKRKISSIAFFKKTKEAWSWYPGVIFYLLIFNNFTYQFAFWAVLFFQLSRTKANHEIKPIYLLRIKPNFKPTHTWL